VLCRDDEDPLVELVRKEEWAAALVDFACPPPSLQTNTQIGRPCKAPGSLRVARCRVSRRPAPDDPPV